MKYTRNNGSRSTMSIAFAKATENKRIDALKLRKMRRAHRDALEQSIAARMADECRQWHAEHPDHEAARLDAFNVQRLIVAMENHRRAAKRHKAAVDKVKPDRINIRAIDVAEVFSSIVVTKCGCKNMLEMFERLAKCTHTATASWYADEIRKAFANYNGDYVVQTVGTVNIAGSQMTMGLGYADGDTANNIAEIDESAMLHHPRLLYSGNKGKVPASREEVTECFETIVQLTIDIEKRLVARGVKLPDGTVTYPYLASPGQMKMGHRYGFDRETIANNQDLLRGGLEEFLMRADNHGSRAALCMSKLAQYWALITTSSYSIKKLGIEISVDDMLIIPDVKHIICGNFRKIEVTADGYKETIVHELEIKISDGCIMLISKDFKGMAFQARCFGYHGKGMAAYFNLVSYLKSVGVTEFVIDDIWGKPHDIIKEGIKVLCYESVIKDSNLFNSTNEFREHVRKLGEVANDMHVVNLANRNGKHTGMSRQTVQALNNITNEELECLLYRNLDGAERYLNPEAGSAVLAEQNTAFGKIASAIGEDIVKSMVGTMALKEIREKYIREVCFDGVGDGQYGHCYMDPTALAELSFGLKKATDEHIGVLSAGHIACRWLPFAGGRPITLGRYPANGYKLQLAKLSRTKEVNYWFDSDCVYFSANDAIISLIDGDFDGDEVLMIYDPIVAYRTAEMNKNVLPVTYELPAAPKVPYAITAKERVNQIVTAWQYGFYYSLIGQASNIVTKLFANGCDELAIAYGSAYCQAAVDATKAGVQPPQLAFNIVAPISDKHMPYSSAYKDILYDESGNMLHIGTAAFNKACAERFEPCGDAVTDRIPKMFLKCLYKTQGINFRPNWEVDDLNSVFKVCLPPQESLAMQFDCKSKIDDDDRQKLIETLRSFDCLSLYEAKKFEDADKVSMFDIVDAMIRHMAEMIVAAADDDDKARESALKTREYRLMRMRELLVKYIKPYHMRDNIADKWTNEDSEQFVLMCLLKHYFFTKPNPAPDGRSEAERLTTSYSGRLAYQRAVFEMFGDLMIENIEHNRAAGEIPQIGKAAVKIEREDDEYIPF